jgi:PKD repeat protein
MNNTHAGTASATATFGGDANHLGSTGSATFIIQKFLTTIDWNNPADIPQGTALSSLQLNAVARGVGGADITNQGTFTYYPLSGTVLVNVGPATLSASFTSNNTDYKDAGQKSVSINVTNVPPTVAAIVSPTNPVPLGSSITITTSFTDPGGAADNPYAIVVNWGNDPVSGLPLAPTSTTMATPGAISQSHAYAAAGIYTITVTVTDKNGGIGSNTTTSFVVVYDPNGGFVTGGGWINSPDGACLLTPDCLHVTGKATFGFVSKYKKGQSTPDGDTEFQFHEGNLNFKSTAYDWLVLSGTKAQYKGSGTINGSGDYGFMLTAIDGDLKSKGSPDTFRIKIWDKASGITVYDNQPLASDTDDPTTALGGGSIQIHN